MYMTFSTLAERYLVFVPFLGDFFSIMRNLLISKRSTIHVFVPFLGDFFSIAYLPTGVKLFDVFVPFLGDFFSIKRMKHIQDWTFLFVPFLGDFFSIACLRSPSPSALASAFAAGMGESLHQTLSFGDEMPIFPVRAGIGGDLS